ncbi:MAG: AAA family ATPase [Bacteroidales bacterium]|jgi:predicted ATP-dependent serine protease|nr:AAA family ATPase [Bacteroidales bacterium]
MIDKDNKKTIENQLQEAEDKLKKLSPFITKSAQQFVDEFKNHPDLQKLFGTFWLTGELTILAGDTGIGKSLIAAQLLSSITNKEPYFLGQEITYQRKAIYFDFELSDYQFAKRYKKHKFHSSFIRSRFNYDYEGSEIFSIRHIREKIIEEKAEIVIIDNISATTLRPTQETDVALELMRELKKLTREGISCLVIAHTPKFSNITSLEINHMAGSKVLANFSDSVFFIHRSKENFNYRYLKQVKARNAEQLEDVIVCRIEEKDGFLGFEYVKHDDEQNHVSNTKPKDPEELKQEIQSLSSEGKSIREIAKILGISKSKVHRYLNSN